MKLWGLILLGVTAAGAASAAWMMGRQESALPDASARRAVVERVMPEPAAVAVASDPLGTFLGIDDDLAIDHLRRQPIVETKVNRGGTSISFRLTLADGSHAAYKPVQRNPQTVPRKEVAAYRLNRLLGLRGVPPATMRTIHRDDLVAKMKNEGPFWRARVEKETIFDAEGFTRGQISLWVPHLVDSLLESPPAVAEWTRYLTVGVDIPEDKLDLMAQLSSLLILDELENNSDRFSGGNLLLSPNARTLYIMDNTFGFQPDPDGHVKCRGFLQRSQKFSRRLVEQLRRLDLPTLRRAFDDEPGVLSENELRAIVARGRWTLRYIDRLVAVHGARRVLVFP